MNTKVKEVEKRLKRLGYEFSRQSGSHMIYKHPKTGALAIIVAPRGMQGGHMRLSTMRKMLKRAEEGAKT